MKFFVAAATGALLLSLSLIPSVQAAQAHLETPAAVSFQSGIGVVSAGRARLSE